jgi:hypothetical protein
MFNPFNAKRHPLEEELDNSEPFDKRIKQIEAIRKNRLMQLEKAKQQAQRDLNDNGVKLNEGLNQTIQEALYYAILEPIIEHKFLFLDVNVKGLTRWVDEVKLLRQYSQDSYNTYYTYIQDWLTHKQNFEHAKQECHAMLIQTEKLALLETLWNESGGI